MPGQKFKNFWKIFRRPIFDQRTQPRLLGIPLHLDGKSFIAAYFLAIAFGFVFALYPAYKAAKLSPIEALHYE